MNVQYNKYKSGKKKKTRQDGPFALNFILYFITNGIKL